MVIVHDRVSDLLRKGEVAPRYYNPGNLFSAVHLVLTNDDAPNPLQLQTMVGDASLHVHNLPTDPWLFLRTLGWRPVLLRPWAEPIVALAGRIRPRLIRCHGAYLNGFVGAVVKERHGVPLALSLHINPDDGLRRRPEGIMDWVASWALPGVERIAIEAADRVLPVYSPILPYLQKFSQDRVQLAYNVVGVTGVRVKSNYEVRDRFRIICVGRQDRHKNPEPLIRAVATIPECHLTLVGDGRYHDQLQRLSRSLKVNDRVDFKPSVANSALCQMLADFDLFVEVSPGWEFSKAVIEALLAGLPLVASRRKGVEITEFDSAYCLLVEGHESGFRQGILKMMGDPGFRESCGRTAAEVAARRWDPAVTESVFVDIYRDLMLPGTL